MRKGILAAALSLLGGSVAWGQETIGTGDCAPPPRIWGSAEYLLWWVKHQSLSTPLVTASTNPGLLDANGFSVSGGVGRDGTVVLVGPGGAGISYDALSGGRVTLGMWLNPEGTLGAEARGFALEQGRDSHSIASDGGGNPQLGNPIFDIAGQTGENSILTADPGIAQGDAAVISRSRLWGAEANAVLNFARSEGQSLDILAGFRYVDLLEDVSVLSRTTALTPVAGGGGVSFLNGFFDGTTTAADAFRGRNQFYGGQLGVRGEMEFFERIGATVTAKLAMGSTHQVLNIGGVSTLEAGGVVTQAVGGIYALPSNIGRYSRDSFTVIPEVEAKLSYKVTGNLRGFVGYNFMYWSDVIRPGQQFNRIVDTRQVPTIPGNDTVVRTNPGPQFSDSGFWAQGMNFGVEVRY